MKDYDLVNENPSLRSLGLFSSIIHHIIISKRHAKLYFSPLPICSIGKCSLISTISSLCTGSKRDSLLRHKSLPRRLLRLCFPTSSCFSVIMNYT
mmetsp:Transcript_25482/g.50873  ORF Transcript_25482/g.50873 Transcript_25482/m.50873 type:complete len:95 (+) Transcript_25482:383-667(+)